MKHPLAWIGIGAWIGAILWPWASFDPVLCLAASAGMAVLSLWAHSTLLLRIIGMAGGVLLGIAACGQQPQLPDPAHLDHIQGTVISRSNRDAVVETSRGKVLLRFENPPHLQARIAAWTRPMTHRTVLPGGWNDALHLQRSHMVRRRAISWIQLGAGSPRVNPPFLDSELKHPGVLRALATGDRSGVPDWVRDRLRRTGTIHLLAISGLHVGLVSGMASGIGWLLTRPLALGPWAWPPRLLPAFSAIVAAWAYGSSVGWPVSTQRATWMVAAAALAHVLGRRPRMWNIFGLALIGVVLLEPGQAGSLGFLLSFGAVAGMFLWAPIFIRWIPSQAPWPIRWIGNSISATLGALIGTLPIAAWVFQSLAPSAPLANLIATPLLAGVAVPGSLLGAHGDFAWAAKVADMAVEGALTILSVIDMEPWTPAVGLPGALGLGLAVCLAARPRWAVALVVLILIPWRPVSGHLEVTFPDVGQGASALVTWPDGRHWLIDGGPPSRSVLHWLRRQGIRHLDSVFLTHAHPDHMGGLIPILSALDVDHLWAPRRPRTDEVMFFHLWRNASLRGIQLHLPGDPLSELIHPEPDWTPPKRREDNDRSLVLSIEHGAHSFLLTGDIEAAGEAKIAENLRPVTVVQVPHHGSRSSSSISLVRQTNPTWAVVQAGRNNRYGHPHPAVQGRWSPRRLLRTDTHGTLWFRTDGNQLQTASWMPETGWISIHERAGSGNTPSSLHL